MRADTAARQERTETLVGKLEADIAALRTLIGAQDDRMQRKFRAGLSSAVNLMSVLPQLKIEGVVPPFPHKGFEITGELAAFLYHLIRRHRPRLIVELGSGSSTVLLAASARANGAGRVLSFEHDAEHRDRTARFLEHAGLSDWVELVDAPLVEQRFGERSMQWYGLSGHLRSLAEKIDLLLVDGPPGKLQSLSRYPALPALLPHLAPRAHIMIDDGQRADELRMVELWRELDDVRFDTEPLDFLPRTPVLLTMRSGESSVTELHRPGEAERRVAGS